MKQTEGEGCSLLFKLKESLKKLMFTNLLHLKMLFVSDGKF
jgi:hypothetical protein